MTIVVATNPSTLPAGTSSPPPSSPPPVNTPGWLDTAATLLSAGEQQLVQWGVGGEPAFQNLVKSLPGWAQDLTWGMADTVATGLADMVGFTNLANGNYASALSNFGGVVGGGLGLLAGDGLCTIPGHHSDTSRTPAVHSERFTAPDRACAHSGVSRSAARSVAAVRARSERPPADRHRSPGFPASRPPARPVPGTLRFP